MKNKHLKQGFTLIELLVVVLIIGILAAVALPQYQTAVEKSRTAEALTLLKHIQDAYTVQYLADPSIIGESDPRDIVDLASGTWSNDGYSFCTKNFAYWFEYPDITAMRANSIEADCSDASDWLYAICEGVPDGSGYENHKECSSYTDVGYKVCQGLVAQGFEPDDRRE